MRLASGPEQGRKVDRRRLHLKVVSTFAITTFIIAVLRVRGENSALSIQPIKLFCIYARVTEQDLTHNLQGTSAFWLQYFKHKLPEAVLENPIEAFTHTNTSQMPPFPLLPIEQKNYIKNFLVLNISTIFAMIIQ